MALKDALNFYERYILIKHVWVFIKLCLRDKEPAGLIRSEPIKGERRYKIVIS